MKIYQLTDINGNDIIASKSVMASHYLGNQRYRHLMCHSGEENFDIQLPLMVTSPIIEEVDSGGGEKSYHLLANVYTRYQEIYAKVCREIDMMLAYAAPELLYESLFFMEMCDRRGYDYAVLKQRYDEYDQEVDEALFRHLVLSFLIPAKLIKETDDIEIGQALARLKQAYCQSLDSEEYRLLKRQLCGSDENSGQRVDEIIKWYHCQTRPDRIDYSKSPYVEIQLMLSKPSLSRSEEESSLLLMPGTKQILWTKLSLDNVPITTRQEFESLLQCKGSLLQSIQVITPAVYWREEEKKALIQFRARRCDIFLKTTPEKKKKKTITNLRCTECHCLLSAKACNLCSRPICYGCLGGFASLSCYECTPTKIKTLNLPLFVAFIIFLLTILIKCFV